MKGRPTSIVRDHADVIDRAQLNQRNAAACRLIDDMNTKEP